MNEPAFRPTLFFNEQCPFCMKVRIFLLEAGLRDAVEVRDFAPGSAEETAIKAMLATHLDKVTVPAAELAPGEFVADTATIIERLAGAAGVDAGALPVTGTYGQFVLPKLVELYRENMSLKQQLSA